MNYSINYADFTVVCVFSKPDTVSLPVVCSFMEEDGYSPCSRCKHLVVYLKYYNDLHHLKKYYMDR